MVTSSHAWPDRGMQRPEGRAATEAGCRVGGWLSSLFLRSLLERLS